MLHFRRKLPTCLCKQKNSSRTLPKQNSTTKETRTNISIMRDIKKNAHQIHVLRDPIESLAYEIFTFTTILAW